MANKGYALIRDDDKVLDGKGNPVGVAYNHLDTTHSPVLLCKFDGDLTDSSGNGFDLTRDSGTERYTDLLPGLRGVRLDQSTKFYKAYEAALKITGDVTIQVIVNIRHIGNNNMTILDFSNNGELEADNILYRIDIDGVANYLRYWAEEGVGTNIEHSIDDGLTPGVTTLVQMVRENDEVTFSLNGTQISATSSGLSTPTGGTSGKLWVGDDSSSGGDFDGAIGSLKIVTSALTQAQLQAEATRVFGISF